MLSICSSPQPRAKPLGDTPAGFQSEFKTIDGVRLHYVKGGKDPLVLLVHGFGQNWYKWRGIMPLLARDFTVVAPVLPAAYLYGLAKAFSPDAPFHVVAHDIGVWNTYPMIAHHPAEVRSVVYDHLGRSAQAIGVPLPGHVATTDAQAPEEISPHHKRQNAKIGAERGWPPVTREISNGRLTAARFTSAPRRRSPGGVPPRYVYSDWHGSTLSTVQPDAA